MAHPGSWPASPRPPIVLFALIAAWSGQRVLFHWAAPGYLMLFPLLGEAVATRLPQPGVRRTLAGTAALRRADRRRRRHPGALRLAASRHRPRRPPGPRPGGDRLDLATHRPRRARPAVARHRRRRARLARRRKNRLRAGSRRHRAMPEPRRAAVRPGQPAGALHRPDLLLLVPEHADRAIGALAPLFDSIDTLPPAPILHAGRTLADVAVLHAHRLHAWPPP